MLDNDPLWYKDAILYEVHVRAFHDLVGDGFGDFQGLTTKLDYLADLGVTAIWLLPFYPSPLKDDGYDIADYTTVHPSYGRLPDFKLFLDEAHRRGLRVITELVINHTSDQHPWFQRARRAPKGSPERDFYVWSDTPDRYAQARIIFKDFEPSNWTYDPVAKAYYWHRFYHHQPDLNFDNPAVWEALFPILDQWLEMGVDGMRLDAIPYLFEREGTNCENLAETHVFLKALRKRMDEKFKGRMFLAEANQWPEDAVAYFGEGDECHMAFHFPVMPRLFMALHQEDRFPIIDILAQTPAIPENCQWCLFLRNHDELTLEMVTDEERDYMVRAYAEDRSARINLGIRRRLAPLLKNDRRRIELMNALLFSLPGTPVLYYGDEIGMGDNIYLGDRNGVRTPMQWSADRNAGFSRANPQKLYLPIIIDPEYHYEAINVEAQQNNPSSLLWWMKRLIALRKRYKAFGRGTIQFLEPANAKVLAFLREYGDERILVVANLSRFVQYVELDLRNYAGSRPEELFGRTLLPPITEAPYALTLGPHAFYWFALAAAEAGAEREPVEDLPILTARHDAEEVFAPAGNEMLEALLPQYIHRRRPPGAFQRPSAAHLEAVYPLEYANFRAHVLAVRLEYREGLPEVRLLPLAAVPADRADSLLEPAGTCALARVTGPREMLVVDALAVPEYNQALLEALVAGKTFRLGHAELTAVPRPALLSPAIAEAPSTPIRLHRSERQSVSVHFGTRAILKSYRRIEDGINPDLEIGLYLTAQAPFAGASPVLAHLEYRRPGGREASTLAVLHAYVPNQGNAWQLTLDQLAGFFERVAALPPDQAAQPTPEALDELSAGFTAQARVLGQRTAEMHAALAAGEGPAFAPEPIGKLYQRSVYQSLRTLAGQLCARLRRERRRLGEAERALAQRVIDGQAQLLAQFDAVRNGDLGGLRIRIHGDYHLGQLLYTGNNFVVIDFEGDPARSVSERRIKRSPLRDVATLLRSLDYAVGSVMTGRASGKGRPPGLIRGEDVAGLVAWGRAWYERVGRAYLLAYLEHITPAGLIPTTPAAVRGWLDNLLLERALQEVAGALDTSPEEIQVPLEAIVRQLDGQQTVERW